MPIQRRDFIKGLGAATGLAACRGPGESDAPPASIDHLIFTMMENRSFDHVFGSLLLEEGRADVDGLLSSHQNPLPDGTPVAVRAGSGTCVDPDPPHGWNASRVALDGGTNLGFVQAYIDSHGSNADYTQVMGYLNRSMAPISYACADRYALAQRWFSSLATNTWPNRLYSHGAQSEGMTSNDLPSGEFFTMRTIWDQLDDAGVPWAYYYFDLPFLAFFNKYNDRLRPIEDFFTDAANGTLPPVSMIEPGVTINDDHPPHHPMLGQVFLGTVHNALAASPLWNKLLWAVCYDEAGGFFDHVPPGTAPDDRAAAGFDQLGFRVPAMLIGPWVKQSHASDTLLDHTSWLAHVQRKHGLEPLTARDAAANDFSSLLDEERMATGEPLAPAELPVIALTQEEILAQCTNRSRTASGQPELEALVRATAPELDRTGDVDRIAAFLFDKAVELGVVLPR